MTDTDMVKTPSWRRSLPWVAALVALVLIVPMATFGRNVLFGTRPQTPAAKPMPVVSGGVGYETREAFSLPAGDGDMEADVHTSPDGVLVSSVEVVAPSPDGRYVWVVDHPVSVREGARVRRFTSDGKLGLTFTTQPASTVFTPGVEDDLWAVRSSGSARETLVRYGADGTVVREYVMPEGLIVRSIALDPDGEVWVQYEEWIVDPQTNQSAYSSSLTPIVQADGQPVPDVTPEKSADGSFLGADDRIYWPSTAPGSAAGASYPPFVVIARDSKGERVSEYDIADGGRPYAADKQGRVFTETRLPDPGQAPGVSTLGDVAYNRVRVGVHSADGEYAHLWFTRSPGMGQWAPIAWPTAEGDLYSWLWDAGRLRVLVSSPVEDTPVRVADAQPAEPEARIIVSTGAPASGDPYRAIDANERDFWQSVYAGLVSVDASLNAVPELAESVPAPGAGVSSDGRTITWRMREGRVFHDGRPVTAADVVATWQHLQMPSPVDRAEPFPGFDLIESVEADGRDVTVRLREPFGPAPQAFFPFVLPKHVLDESRGISNSGLYARPIGAGPYKVTRWERARMQLERVASGDGIRRMDVVFESGEKAQQAFMGASVPTVWAWVPETDAQILRRDAVGTITPAPTGRWFGLVVNEADPVVADERMRSALLGAYPAEVVRDLYGLPATSTVAPYGQPVSIDGWADGEKGAKALGSALDRAGYVELDPDGFRKAAGQRLRLRYSQTMRGQEQHETVSEVEETYKRIVKITDTMFEWENGQHNFYAPVDGAGFLSRGRHQLGSGVFPGFADAGWGSVFDPADTPSWNNPDGLGVTFTEDGELRRLHEQARAEYDSQRRAEIGDRIIERVRELKLAYFDRPEIRPVATIGISGGTPAPFPAGLFHDVEQWTAESQR